MTDDVASETVLVVQDVSKVFARSDDAEAATTTAIEHLSLTERRGTFLSIVGPSGCGKTTLLKLIAGLELPTAGTIVVDGRMVDGPPGTAIYVFQEYSKSLLPWRTVAGNVALGLESRGLSRDVRQERTRRYLDLGCGMSRRSTRGSSPAACSSALSSRGHSPANLRFSSSTNRSARWTP
jgi:NitT/TauT family transport system ATP-binding protein